GGEVAVTVSVDDQSEALIFDTVFLFDGEDSGEFGIEVVNDLFPDGAQTVTVTASAPGFSPATATFEVTDDGDDYGLVVNEVFYVSGDANGDGLA
ncbi:MAG: hypothetical protein GWO24_05155, partial [Akkermansiaceae bacterium]|nr:hypothetical protein [Akkermansiaceae bacterium]